MNNNAERKPMPSQVPPGLHLIGEYGEALMQHYLDRHNIPYEREPVLQQTARKLDFAISIPESPRVLIEVKTIWKPPPLGFSQVDFHGPIRKHIAEAARQFSQLPDTINVVALAVFPGSMVDLQSPHTMLSAMYGDLSLSIPFDMSTGRGNAENGEWFFAPGNGEMIRREGKGIKPRNSRIAALLSLQPCTAFWPEFGGRQELPFAEYRHQAISYAKTMAAPYVTLWENASAKTRVPSRLFTGSMDQRWGVIDGVQCPTFTGEERSRSVAP